MNSDNKIRKNYIYNLSYQILVLIVPLITMPYISRVMGAESIGTVNYAQSVVTYFTLFATMGIFTFGQREISYVRDSREKSSIVFWETKLLSIIVSLTVLAVYFVFSFFQKDRPLYFILSFSVISVLADITWFFQGFEDFRKIVIRNFLSKIAGVIYIFLFVKSPGDVNRYAFSLTFFTLLGNISLWPELGRYIVRVPVRDLHPFRNFSAVLSLFIPTIAIQIYTVLDKTMIGLITKNAAENCYYEQAIMIAKMALAIVTALGTVLVPRIGYCFEHDDHDSVRDLMYRAYRFVWFLGIPLCFGIIAVSRNFVPWFYGPGYDKIAYLLSVLAFLIPAIGISNVTGIQYLIPTKQQGLFTRSVLIGAVTNFCLNSVLIIYFQSVGAAVASIIAETVISAVQLRFVRKELSWKRILRSGIRYFISGAVMLCVLLIAGAFLSPSVIHTIEMVLAGAVLYFVLLLLMKDDLTLSAKDRILSVLSHK